MSQLTRGVFGRKPSVSTRNYSDVFNLDTQFIASTTGTWVGTIPTTASMSPAFADDIGGIALRGSNSNQNCALSLQFYNLTSDGMYYQLRTDMSSPDFTDRGAQLCTSISSSADGKYIVYGVSLYINYVRVDYIIFRRDEYQFRYKYSFGWTDVSNSSGLASSHFNPSGTLLALTDNTGIKVYSVNGDTPTLLPTLSGTFNTSGAIFVQWNWDGTRLAATDNTYGLYIWNVSGTTFTLIASGLTGTGRIAWKRDNGSLITASGHYYVFSSNSSAAPVLGASIGGLGGGGETYPQTFGNESWNRHGNLLVTASDSNSVKVRYVSGNTFTTINVSATVTGTSQAFFSGTSDYMVALNTSTIIDTYTVTGNTFTRHANVRCGTNTPDGIGLVRSIGVIHKSS